MSSTSFEQKYTRLSDSIVNSISIEMYSKHGNTLYFHFFHSALREIMELYTVNIFPTFVCIVFYV
jgi:hypothetical protein